MTQLKREKYISLATFRKTGKEVATPVWFVTDPDRESTLYVFTARGSGKIKRLRNFSRSKVAACDIRGKVHGEWIDATTIILDDSASEQTIRKALRLFRAKYPVAMRMADLGARLSGRYSKRAYLEVEIASQPAEAS